MSLLFHNMIVKGLELFISYVRPHNMHSIAYKFNLHRMHTFTHSHIHTTRSNASNVNREPNWKCVVFFLSQIETEAEKIEMKQKKNPNAFHDAETWFSSDLWTFNSMHVVTLFPLSCMHSIIYSVDALSYGDVTAHKKMKLSNYAHCADRR